MGTVYNPFMFRLCYNFAGLNCVQANLRQLSKGSRDLMDTSGKLNSLGELILRTFVSICVSIQPSIFYHFNQNQGHMCIPLFLWELPAFNLLT